MHTGSIHAVCTSDPDSYLGYRPNEVQKLFLEHWEAVRDWVGNVNILVLNGEPFNGPNIKQNGDENWTSKMDEQIRESYRLLKMFKFKVFIITKGSNYHIKRDNTNYEEMLAEKLNALPYQAYNIPEQFKVVKGRKLANVENYKGKRVDVFVTFKLNGRNINFTHHLGFSARYYYRATALSAEMAQLIFDRGYYYPEGEHLDILGRGHVHYTLYLRFPNSHGFVTPCWKLPDEHLFRHGLGGTRPNVGASLVTIEQNGNIIYDDLIMKKTFPRPYIPDLTDLSSWNTIN